MQHALALIIFLFTLTFLDATEPYTGEVTSNRVRMRLLPSTDSQIISELSSGDLLLIDAEVDHFAAVIPPSSMKGYIFRTYILDGKIEGTNVNVRLEPSTQAPVVTQLSTGHPISGKVSEKNPKWLEIDLPKDVRFYVYADYIHKKGSKEEYFLAQNKKHQPAITTPSTVVNSTKEEKNQPNVQTSQPSAKADQLEVPVENPDWKKQEDLLFAEHSSTYTSIDAWYKDERKNALFLQGVLEPFDHAVHNKPGDFILMDEKTHLPLAYVYSTKYDLRKFLHKKVGLFGKERSNNNFAFPAYVVLDIDVQKIQ